MFKRIYWLFAHLGMMTVSGSFIAGFKYAPDAPVANVFINIAMYAAFITVHIIMTTAAFKRAVFGKPEGTPSERRVYITTTIVTWVAVLYFHRPVPGFAFVLSPWLGFLGLCAVLLSLVAFFEFATLATLSSFLGVPGAELSHSAGDETPLFTEGPYASVRHPMYRAFVCLALSSLLMHPNAGQLLFAIMVIASFLCFVPIEERQLLKRRGDEYRAYMTQTPYRVFRGIW